MKCHSQAREMLKIIQLWKIQSSIIKDALFENKKKEDWNVVIQTAKIWYKCKNMVPKIK